MTTHWLRNRPWNHTGQDYVGPIGTPVFAAAAGRVSYARYRGEHGNHIVIDHGGGWQTTYSHLLKTNDLPEVGSCVAAGQLISKIGSTGFSPEPHLHFELLKDGIAIDPSPQR